MEIRRNSVAILLPTLNEVEGLEPTVMEIRQFLGDPYFLVVDGNSTDGTVEVAKRLGLNVVAQDGRGKGCAIAQGIRCLEYEPRYIIFIDADYTYPAEYIPEMIEILDGNPQIGMVSGNRFNARTLRLERMRNPYYVGNRLLAHAQHLVNGVKLNDPLTGLRVVRWEILKGWQPRSKGFDVEAELNYYVEREGYKIHEIPIHYRKRLGEKKLKLKDGLIILERMLVESLQES